MQAVDRLALRLIHPAQRIAATRQRLELLSRRLGTALQSRLRLQPRLDQLRYRLTQSMTARLARQRDRLARHAGALAALSPHATLERGYSIARSADGRIIHSAGQLAPGDNLQLQFAHGRAHATVDKVDL